MISTDVPSLLAAVAEVTTQAETRIERLRQRAASDGMPVSCSGCTTAGCCYQLVPAFIAEAIYIAHIYPVAPHKRQAMIDLGTKMENTSQPEWFRSATPCHFLTANNMCGIYDRRPGACRRYHVVSKPEMCMPDKTDKVSVLNTMDLDNDWVLTLARFQVHYLGAPLLPMMLGALPKMIAIASNFLDIAATGDNRKARRYLRDQTWMDFITSKMAQVDPETRETMVAAMSARPAELFQIGRKKSS